MQVKQLDLGAGIRLVIPARELLTRGQAEVRPALEEDVLFLVRLDHQPLVKTKQILHRQTILPEIKQFLKLKLTLLKLLVQPHRELSSSAAVYTSSSQQGTHPALVWAITPRGDLQPTSHTGSVHSRPVLPTFIGTILHFGTVRFSDLVDLTNIIPSAGIETQATYAQCWDDNRDIFKFDQLQPVLCTVDGWGNNCLILAHVSCHVICVHAIATDTVSLV